MIAHAVHPALVSRIPVRARTVRADWQRVVTAVEVPEASTRETEQVRIPALRTERNTHPGPLVLHDGRLFAPLTACGRPVSAAGLAAALEGAHPPAGEGLDEARYAAGLLAAFADTPLCLPYRGHPRSVASPGAWDRGDELGPCRAVRRDCSAAAAQAVRDFAGEDLLVVAGAAHRRVVPLARPFRQMVGRDGPRTLWEVGYHVMSYAGMAALMTGPVDPDGLEPARGAYLARHGEGGLRARDDLGDWPSLPRTVFGERAAEAVANNLPGVLRRFVEHEERRLPALRLDRDPAAFRRLADLETEGLNRSWRGARAAECLTACEGIIGAYAARVRGVGLSAFDDGCVTAHEMLRRVHLPRFVRPVREIDAEDAAALAML